MSLWDWADKHPFLFFLALVMLCSSFVAALERR